MKALAIVWLLIVQGQHSQTVTVVHKFPVFHECESALNELQRVLWITKGSLCLKVNE